MLAPVIYVFGGPDKKTMIVSSSLERMKGETIIIIIYSDGVHPESALKTLAMVMAAASFFDS